MQAPHGLTRAVAEKIVSTMSALPQPVFVQCATGNRASAAIGEEAFASLGGYSKSASAPTLIATMLQCLFSKLAALHMGASHKWDAGQTMKWATDNGLKFLGTQPLRNWVSAYLAPLAPLDADRQSGLFFRQLFEPVSSTYTYLLAGEGKIKYISCLKPQLPSPIDDDEISFHEFDTLHVRRPRHPRGGDHRPRDGKGRARCSTSEGLRPDAHAGAQYAHPRRCVA